MEFQFLHLFEVPDVAGVKILVAHEILIRHFGLPFLLSLNDQQRGIMAAMTHEGKQ